MIISVSVVTFEPDLQVLERCFVSLQRAFVKLNQHYSAKSVLYLVDNSKSVPIGYKIQKLMESTFEQNKEIGVHYIKTGKNIGYGGANNIAIQASCSTYHIIMNPDVFIMEDALLQAINYLEVNKDIALLTPSVCGDDGVRHYLCKKNPTLFDMYLRSFAPAFLKRKFHERMRAFEMREKNYDQEIRDVPFPTGCFMFFRTGVLKKIGGFDSRFFMYFEDADLGRRLLSVSHSAYVPAVKVIHLWGREQKKKFKMLVFFIFSALRYSFKYTHMWRSNSEK